MRRFLTSLTVLGVLATSTLIWACSVPVFRYALERWPADKYSAVVFHRGPLDTAQQQLLKQFEKEGAIQEKSANVELRLVNLDEKPAPEDLALWKMQKSETLPLLVLRTPLPAPVPTGFWSGELTQENLSGLIDSPLRQKIAKQLIKGQTGVWVFLETGDPEKDKPAYELLVKEVKRMEKTLKLPEIDEADIEQGLVSVSPDSLKLQFQIEKCSKKNVAESQFIQMLLATENDLKDFQDEPMAFPVFGRGRVLYALIGKGINPGTIEQACRDLTGPCTCQVKDQNPGTDLLMAVKWDDLVTPTAQDEKELPPLTGLTGFSQQPGESSDALPMPAMFKSSVAENKTVASPAEAETGDNNLDSSENSSAVKTDAGVVAASTETEQPAGTATGSLNSAQGGTLFRNLTILAAFVLVLILAASYKLMVRK